MAYFKACPYCGAALDPGERCDCRKVRQCMASIRTEFHDDEQALMWETFSMLERLLGPKSLKPPQKNTDGKWHFYMESPDHKKKSKGRKQSD